VTESSSCPVCAWPASDVYEVISRHLTSEGVVTYSRCACGEVQVRFQPYSSAEFLQSRP
jgi:transcriptional regulator NrdR family protein